MKKISKNRTSSLDIVVFGMLFDDMNNVNK